MHTKTAERARQAETVQCCRDVYPLRRVPERYQGVRAGLAYVDWLMAEDRMPEARQEILRMIDQTGAPA